MNPSNFEEFSRLLEEQKEELLEVLARLSIDGNYDIEIEAAEDSPLGELYVGVSLAARNLKHMADQLEKRVLEAERTAKTLAQQSATIRELSTPVLQIWDDILVLPLIGVVDTARARQIVDDLLSAISKSQAAVAILDITGVPVVDTGVADHLLRTMQAVRILGAEVLLTGVTPANAQTLVRLGVDLSSVVTKGTLVAGLKWAMQKTQHSATNDQVSP